MAEKKQLLSTDEVLAYLKIGRRTLFRYLEEGMPVIRVTKRKNLYDLDKINEWLEKKSK
ncbi:helix-turn-helix transcriptional regulator [Brevibacillus thermoruber]|uniref:helix-turn-helix transcriptional regulator n=1 Tax=Brevibacillus thermoruber TaxID=33942 RepID=UPI0012E0A47F|nr:hypothetical protein [Brevibacillus thermoruber]